MSSFVALGAVFQSYPDVAAKSVVLILLAELGPGHRATLKVLNIIVLRYR